MFNSVKIREGHDNFFTPLRLLFATLVVIGHSFAIALRDSSAEPHVFYIYTFSYIAVNLFFIASGFLVTKSMLYREDKAEFASARILRIFPGLLIHVLFVMIVIGTLGTSLPLVQFFTSSEVYLQPLYVLSFVKTEMIMPGMFAGNDESLAGGPLWTLRYEVLAYIGTLILFSIGLLKSRWMFLAQFIVPSIAWIFAKQFGLYDQIPATLQSLLRFGVAYGLGAAIFAYRDRISFTFLGLCATVLLAVLTQGTHLAELSLNIMLAYFVFYFAYFQAPKLAWMSKIDDLSYGIYIYHWAILQTVFMYFPNFGVVTLFVTSMILTTILAALSWHFVEKPALSQKKAFAQWLKFKRKKATVPTV